MTVEMQRQRDQTNTLLHNEMQKELQVSEGSVLVLIHYLVCFNANVIFQMTAVLGLQKN